MTSTIFYFLGLLFIINEIYLVYNRQRLNELFENKDIKNTTVLDVISQSLKPIMFIWIILGIWSSNSLFFFILIGLYVIKFPLYHINKRAHIIWDNLLPILNVLIISTLFISYLIKG